MFKEYCSLRLLNKVTKEKNQSRYYIFLDHRYSIVCVGMMQKSIVDFMSSLITQM